MTSRQRSSKLCPGCGRPAVIKTLGKLYDSGILKQAIHKDDRSTHEWTEYKPSKKVGRNQKRDTSIEAEERKGFKGVK
jgi:pyruvate/2-oxoacid:ferredoxin oxidoreductase beta subunit